MAFTEDTKGPLAKSSVTNRPRRLVTEKRSTCVNLTEEQVKRISFFIKNYNRRNMPICLCDIQRVVEMHNDELPTRFEGSE